MTISIVYLLNSSAQREKGIRLITKAFQNIISNPTQISKYGVLNLNKIKQKLPDCKPIFTLFYIAGFRIADDNNRLRLIWRNIPGNLEKMQNICIELAEKKINSDSWGPFQTEIAQMKHHIVRI